MFARVSLSYVVGPFFLPISLFDPVSIYFAFRTIGKIYDEEVVREAFRHSKVALLKRLPILTLPSTLEGERIVSEEEYSLITVIGSSR